MSNMSYVRFENTCKDLQDCYDHLYDEELSETEERYRQRLIKLCRDIVHEAEEYEQLY